LANLSWKTAQLCRERNIHAREEKVGCEKGGSNAEIERGWQEGSEN
jgi:hypothetical protein